MTMWTSSRAPIKRDSAAVSPVLASIGRLTGPRASIRRRTGTLHRLLGVCVFGLLLTWIGDVQTQVYDPETSVLISGSDEVPPLERPPPPPPVPAPPPERVLPSPLPPIEDGGDDWSVLTMAEIEAAIAGMGAPLELVAPRRVWLRWMVAVGGLGLALLLFLCARVIHFRIRSGRLALRMHWAWWLPMAPFLLVLPWTLPFFLQEAAIELRTLKYYLSDRPIVLQGTVRHTRTGEPIAGVWVRYPLSYSARYRARSEGRCAMDLVLRSNGEGRWRAELPVRTFARYIAEYWPIHPDPWLYAPGMQEDWYSKLTAQELERMTLYQDASAAATLRRAEKGDRQALVIEDNREAAERLADPGGRSGSCSNRHYWWPGRGDDPPPIVPVAGPREALERATLREQRDLRCAGTVDGEPWPPRAKNMHGLIHLGPEPSAESRRLAQYLTGLRPGTHEYDKALCRYLEALDP